MSNNNNNNHRDPVLDAFDDTDDENDNHHGDEEEHEEGEEHAGDDDFEENDEEDDDDFETFTGDGGHRQAQGPSLANVTDRLLQARLRQLNTLRRQFMGGAEDEEDVDDDQDGDEDEAEADEGNGPRYSSAMSRIFAAILGQQSSSNNAPRRGVPVTNANNINNNSSGFSALRNYFTGLRTNSNHQQHTANDRHANLISGPAFFTSMMLKKEALFSDPVARNDILAPIAASGNFLMRPHPDHVPTATSFRLHATGTTTSNSNSISSDGNNNHDVESITKPEKNFWNEYEDNMDDALLALAKHEFKNDNNEKNNSNNQSKNHTFSASSSIRRAANNNHYYNDEDSLMNSPADSNHSTPATPKHDRNKTNTHNQQQQQQDNNHQDTIVSGADAAVSSVSVTPTNNNNNNNVAELDYSPWAGPSPVNRVRDEEQKLQQDSSTTSNTAGRVASSGGDNKSRYRNRTVASSSSSSQVVSNCVSFLRSAPALLPTIHRGSIAGCSSLNSISGFSLSSPSGRHYDNDETMLFSIGSRNGEVAVGAFQPSQWKKMIQNMMNSNRNNNNNNNNNNQRQGGGGSHSNNNEDAAENINDNHDDDDDDDDPEFAAMGRNRRPASQRLPSARHTSARMQHHQRLQNFPLQRLETIRRSGFPIYDTAWHPTIPMYASVGGSSEMILGFAGDVLRKVQDQENHPSAGHLSIDAEDEDNDPIMSQNILPRVQQQQTTTATAGTNNNNNAATKRARNLIVDVINEDTWRSRVYGVDFFGHHSIVCGCSAGSVSTVAIRPDGQFVVRPVTVHADDVNAVARFGRDPESCLFVTGSDDRRVGLCDSRVAGGHVAFGSGHTIGVMSLATRKDDHFFASVGKDQVVKLWDIRKLSAPMTEMGMRRAGLARGGDNDDPEIRWNHYSPAATAPPPMQTRGCQASLSMPNTSRFVYTLIRAEFSPFATTGGRYLLVGGCGGSQIFDIVSGGVVANLVWDDAGSADEVMRDVAWIDEKCVVACTQTAAHVFAGY